jgi:dihydrofolate reductase
MKLALVAAVAENGVIGTDGGMPWHHPEDLRRFKATTTGHPVILGRRTYESIVARLGHPLPDRTSVVLSTRDLDLPEGAVHAPDVGTALDLARTDCAERGVETAYVAGGATVYEQFLPRADRLLLTEIHEAHDGDTYFPAWDRDGWREIDREDREALSFVVYERREP